MLTVVSSPLDNSLGNVSLVSWVDQTFQGAQKKVGGRCLYDHSVLREVSSGRGNRALSMLRTRKKKKNAIFPQSKEGKSPLHMAAIHGRFTRSQILIQNGMDLGDFVLSSLTCSENPSLGTSLLPYSTSNPTFQSKAKHL